MKLRTLSFLAGMLLAIASAAWGQSAPSQLTERNNVTAPLTQVLPHTSNEGYGGPRVIQVDYNTDGVINSSDRVFMYVTGVEDFSAQAIHDKVFLFQNENTFSGWNNPYDLAPRITILPKSGSGCVGCDTTVNYGNQWVYKRNGQIHMLSGLGEGTATDPHKWHKVLHGTSSDGMDFQWEEWLKASTNWNLLRMGLVEVQISGGTYLYGFIDLKDRVSGPFGLGAMRYDPANERLWFVVDNAWEEIPTCSSVGDTSGYRFCMFYDGNNPEGTSIDPDIVAPGRHPSFHKLSRHGGKLELWASTQAPDHNCGHQDGLANWQNALSYREVSPPASLTALPMLGTLRILEQELVDPVRCNPASYRHSRKTPFRLDWTLDILYSRSWDDPSDPFGPNTTGPEGYIVRTRLENL